LTKYDREKQKLWTAKVFSCLSVDVLKIELTSNEVTQHIIFIK